jgi:hypothetical protein
MVTNGGSWPLVLNMLAGPRGRLGALIRRRCGSAAEYRRRKRSMASTQSAQFSARLKHLADRSWFARSKAAL